MIASVMRSRAACCIVVLIGGCTAAGDNSNAVGGAAVGAAGGGALGAIFGHGSTTAIAAGAVGGALLGGVIGHALDVRDRERREAALNASLKAKTSHKETHWKNPKTGNSGTITPINYYTDPQTNRACRDYDETYTRDGQTYTQRSSACRDASGNWVAKT